MSDTGKTLEDWQSLSLSQGIKLCETNKTIGLLEQQRDELGACVSSLLIALSLNMNQVSELRNKATHNTIDVEEALRTGIKASREAKSLLDRIES